MIMYATIKDFEYCFEQVCERSEVDDISYYGHVMVPGINEVPGIYTCVFPYEFTKEDRIEIGDTIKVDCLKDGDIHFHKCQSS